MRAKSIVLICIALGCGLVASIGISQVIDGKKGQGKGPEMGKIFVAARNIDISEPFAAKNVRLEPWPKNKIPENSITDLKQLEGRYARTRLYEGEPIRKGKMMDAGGGLPEHVPQGYRVLAIKVNMVTAISGLLKPGDRVDIIAVLKKGRDISQTQTKLVLQAVRIFAINSQTERFVDEKGKKIDAKTISVLIKNQQVAPLIMASELGSLRLTMRGRVIDDKEDSIIEEFTVDQFLGKNSEIADDKDKKNSKAGNNLADFTQFLQANAQRNQPPQTAPVIAAPKQNVPRGPRMVVVTPNGEKVYEMTDGKMKLVSTEKSPFPAMTAESTEDEVDSQEGNDDVNEGETNAGDETEVD